MLCPICGRKPPMRLRLIENWRSFWRMWTTRINAIGLALMTWLAVDPVSLLAVWNMMPASVHAVLPRNFVVILGAALFALSMIARLVRQPKLAEPTNAA